MTRQPDIARLRDGDLEVFGELYERFVRKIYDFLYYKTFDREVAEDLTQETFMKALKKIDSFHGTSESEFKSWLYTIAHHTAIDRFRTESETTSLDGHGEIRANAEDPGEHIDRTGKLAEVLGYLDTLPREHRDIIMMRIWDDLSYKEISEITGKSVDNCKKIVSRGLAQIQANIAYLFFLCFFINL